MCAVKEQMSSRDKSCRRSQPCLQSSIQCHLPCECAPASSQRSETSLPRHPSCATQRPALAASPGGQLCCAMSEPYHRQAFCSGKQPPCMHTAHALWTGHSCCPAANTWHPGSSSGVSSAPHPAFLSHGSQALETIHAQQVRLQLFNPLLSSKPGMVGQVLGMDLLKSGFYPPSTPPGLSLSLAWWCRCWAWTCSSWASARCCPGAPWLSL